MKSLLHMAAMTAGVYDQEIKICYERKKAEGKNPMSILNEKGCLGAKFYHRIRKHFVGGCVAFSSLHSWPFPSSPLMLRHS
jgi:hypothetical protein